MRRGRWARRSSKRLMGRGLYAAPALTSRVIDAPAGRWHRAAHHERTRTRTPPASDRPPPVAPVGRPGRRPHGHLHGRAGLLHRHVAMPAMQSDLHAGTGAIEWVVAGYGLTFATFLITAGRLGDQLGRRRMFSLGLALFTLASAACGLAPSPAMLVVARLVQGLPPAPAPRPAALTNSAGFHAAA